MSVQLGTTTIAIEDLYNFSPGDVVVLEQPASQPLLACIEGVPKFLGFGVKQNGIQQFRVDRILLPPE